MLGGITVYAEDAPEGESEQPESTQPPADDKNNAALEGLVKVMKPVAVCGIITGALAVSVAHPTTTPLMAVGAKVAVDAVLSFEVKKPNDGSKIDDAEVEQLPATEEAGEQATVPEVLEEDSNAHLLKEMPDGLPLPNVPRKPNWWEIGWRRLIGRSVNDTIWDRWYPPEPSNYAGGVRPCNGPAGLGEVNDEELNRLDWELEKGFNEALQSEKDFMDGVRVGFLKNMTKLPFNLAGFVLNSREVQDMPDKLESSDVEDEGAYVGGKITADVVTTVLGIIGIVSGVGQIVTGLAGDVGGGALCASGVGIPAGVAVVAGSTTLVVAGAAEVAASASLVYSSVSNFGRDVDELKESKEKKETTSPEEKASEAEISGEATVESADKSGTYSGTGEYGEVGGHHVHAKAGFKGDVNYDPKKGFSISQEFMENNGLNHQSMTSKQRELFKELYESGRPNTLDEHTRIAQEALKAGGASDSMINDLINSSLKNFQEQGVTAPTRIPWYSK